MLFSNLKDVSKEDYNRLIKRSRIEIRTTLPIVEQIIKDVKERGDEAVRRYTKEFDGVDIEEFKVSKEEFAEAKKKVTKEVKDALGKAYRNIREFHERQLVKGWAYERGGAKVRQILRSIQSVGCYIPGGRAAYPSTVLMTVTPALVAGVENIVCVTPPKKDKKANEFVLVACEIAGVKEVYKVGGAQAIAALAFGTQSIPKVDKIVGPGNIYVTAAKKLVSDEVAVDVPAGPSEVLILVDESANVDFIIADMIAQAEHDPNSSSILVTPSKALGAEVIRKLKRAKFSRAEARAAIFNNAAVLIVDKMEQGIKFCNEYAPEHLQIMVKKPRTIIEKIKNAGSIFLGNYTPVACGDYATGANHVLPTGGHARVYSGLGVNDFIKYIPVQEASRDGLKKLSKIIIPLAEAEGLPGHAESIRRRIL